ncbi:GntR family transcriptional regulator [Luedemannella flava]|uniref:GntR family transcriptional regulator n=1 Tax=Luedemannella flava TaxID=349316 RepID=A0ABN2LZP3_9ACTN
MTVENTDQAVPSPRTVRRSPAELCAAIRDDVILGVFAPGQRLTEDGLAERFGVSRMPVREALRMLAVEGFVRIAPYYGTFVAELSPDEAADLLEIRAVLEPLAAARAAHRRTEAHLEQLREVVREGRQAVFHGTLDRLPALNTRFHTILAEASGNTSLNSIVEQLRYKIAWVYAVELPRRAADSWTEHQLIVDALEQGDAELARAVMAEHIRQADAAYRVRNVP